jgi:hypothetical protein
MVSLTKFPVNRVVNWYFGNFCTRKCFNKEERLNECWNKFETFKKENIGLMITHKEFKDYIDNDLLIICKLKPHFRKRTVGWNQFESWLKLTNFDADNFD